MRTKRLNKQKTLSKNSFDKTLFALTIVLTLAGLLSVADASAPQALAVFGNSFYFVRQQIIWAAIGLVAMIFSIIMPYTFWKKTARLIFFSTIILLVMVLIPGVGSRSLGAQRWISIGVFRFQPSEISKLALIISLAYLADVSALFWHYLFVVGSFVGLIMLQPDFGTSIVIAAIGFSQMFISNLPIVYLLGLSLSGSIAGILMVFTSDYRKQRFLTFLESSDPLGTSYHIRQILIAIGSGGLFGVGLGNSRQKHLFLPETATDSVFAVLAEETGFFGSLIIVIILLFFTLRAFKIASRAPDTFSKVLASGIAAWIGGQTLLNLTSMTALTPLTGIPLPFFSYGGSSLVMILMSTGILLNISRYSKLKTK